MKKLFLAAHFAVIGVYLFAAFAKLEAAMRSSTAEGRGAVSGLTRCKARDRKLLCHPPPAGWLPGKETLCRQ
jgi:hypothetical protein